MPFLAAVRYGRMNATEKFIAKSNDLRTGDEVIIRTERGIEFGYIAGAVTTHEPEAVKGRNDILRRATEDDSKIQEHITSVKEPSEMSYCTEQIQAFELPMKLTAVEHLFGGDKIIFYFLADGRVDFRQLVKTLAKQYRTRIEMRQIGVRDEARLLADYEHCGRELCCRTFMQTLEPVTMRMAKLQKTTLDPNKISGHCGRLMCCLRFEDEIYAELKKSVPQKGVFVRTKEHEGEVIDYNLLKQTCLLETSEGERVTIRVEEITARLGKRSNKDQREDTEDNPSQGSEHDSGA
ncbi:MAG: signal peptidase [Planctomycetes bacterium]|nr:signal peptidase [Planctomycetota bacterium]